MPNAFYFISFLLWPILAIKIFNKYRLDKAVILLFLIPYLFLPVAHSDYVIKLPLFPPFDKGSIPVFVMLWLLYKNKIKVRYLPRFRISVAFCLAFFLSPYLTVLSNMDPLVLPGRSIPGLAVSEAFSIFVALYIKAYVPFVVGYSLLRSSAAQESFVVLIFIWGLVYSIIMLYEIRMSPQLHRQIYGFFPHEWRQQLRAGGFRPVAFLGHGLLVALYGCMMTIAAYSMWRDKHPLLGNKGVFFVAYFCAVLMLCKTYSAVIYFLIFLGVFVFFRSYVRLKFAAAVALMVLLFPLIRSWLPLAEITGFFVGLSPERAGSLQFRFDHENLLLDKANERPLFGWGSWGRNRVYDPLTGEDLSVTDGAWILIYGGFGWVGYVGLMGLLCYPLIVLQKCVSLRGQKALSAYTVALAWMLAIFLMDQIPNASLNHLVYLMAGSLLGKAREIATSSRDGSLIR